MQRNEAFLLHAGDCAESFDACTHVRRLAPAFVMYNLPLGPGKYFGETGVDFDVFSYFDMGRESARCASPGVLEPDSRIIPFHRYELVELQVNMPNHAVVVLRLSMGNKY